MKLRVLRDKGLPVDAPIYAFGETFESDDERAATWLKQGYAELVDDGKKERPRKTESTPLPPIESPQPTTKE